jgi:hypothetical protein
MPLDNANVKGMDRAMARIMKMQGKPLEERSIKAMLEGSRLLVGPIRSESPVMSQGERWGRGRGSPGDLRASVKARRGRRDKSAVYVGPTPPRGAHRHLITRGHEVWSHGSPTGYRTHPNPFVMRAVDPHVGEYIRFVTKVIADTSG